MFEPLCLCCCEAARDINKNYCKRCEALGERGRLEIDNILEEEETPKIKRDKCVIWSKNITHLTSGVFEYEGIRYAAPCPLSLNPVGTLTMYYRIKRNQTSINCTNFYSIQDMIDYVCKKMGVPTPPVPSDIFYWHDYELLSEMEMLWNGKNYRAYLYRVGTKRIIIPLPLSVVRFSGDRFKVQTFRVKSPIYGVFSLKDYRTLEDMEKHIWDMYTVNQRSK